MVEVTVNRVPDHYRKCPRCYRHTQEGSLNFDGLCDRCCSVILNNFPDHLSAEGIRQAYQKQQAMTPADWREHNSKGDAHG